MLPEAVVVYDYVEFTCDAPPPPPPPTTYTHTNTPLPVFSTMIWKIYMQLLTDVEGKLEKTDASVLHT